MVLLLTLSIVFVASLIYGSFFEWALHRFVMHRPFLFLHYPFRSHGVTHHGTFGSGRDYHLLEEKNRHLVTMAWWNAPVLLLVNSPAALAAVWLSGTWWAAAAFMAALGFYYGLYEYIHWCMHVPGPRWFQRTRVFRWVDQHHRLHHLKPGTNLNVVFPVADFLLRTRLSRAPIETN